MALLNDLIKTYDSVMGHEPEGMEMIAPIAHQYRSTKQVIDVTIDTMGHLIAPKFEINSKNTERTLLAMTEESSARSSGAAAVRPHGLNDSLFFMVKGKDNRSYEAYRKQLEEWCESESPCIQAEAVLKYISNHNIVEDMLTEEAIPKEKDGSADVDKYKKYTVRWRVLVPDGALETWKNEQTINSWTKFYERKHAENSEWIIDSISGEKCDKETVHPKPISIYGNSKLISVATQENSVFHFKGERFTNADQLPQLGYQNSQKLHNALGWLIDTQAIPISKSALSWCTTDHKPKYLVCWMPAIPQDNNVEFQMRMLLGQNGLKQEPKYKTYYARMKRLIFGTKDEKKNFPDVSLLMTDRSGDGRFSPVLYKSFSAEEYFDKIREWHDHCAWFTYDSEWAALTMKPVSLFEIARCAYGVQRFNQSDAPYLDVNDAVFKDTVNTLLASVLDNRPIPTSLIQQIASQVSPERFAGNKGHEMQPFKQILRSACALLHWWHIRKNKDKEERDLSLDKENTDRSYLYGRLLAVFDCIENAALNRRSKKDEQGKFDHRDTNAMRLWSAYVAHPSVCAANLQKCVIPYLSSLPYGLRTYYENELTEIGGKIAEAKTSNRPLSPEYLHGFYLERAALLSGKHEDKKAQND